VLPDVGQGEAAVELAVARGDDAGPPHVAVESDGPRYAALPSVRDRDRLRAEQLARRGWTPVRVWSTDVFRDPARDVEHIRHAATEAGS
jgi:very-short-patch-repair endonuclease